MLPATAEAGLRTILIKAAHSKHPRSRTLACFLLIGMGVSLAFPTYSQSFFSDVYVGGFVSQGYFKSTEYNHLFDNGTKGTSEFNEAALTILALPADNLRIGLQFLAKDAGDVGNNNVILDWAFGDYRWRDWLGFRGGKIKMQMGMYNMGQDIDMSRTPIFLPQSVYSIAWRDFTLAHEGIGIYGNHDVGVLGSFEFEAYGGALNVPDPSNSYWKKEFSSDAAFSYEVIASALSDTISYDFVRTENTNPTFPWTAGGAITWNVPVDGFRLASSINFGEYDLSFQSVVYRNVTHPTTGALIRRTLETEEFVWNERYAIAVFSLEYTWQNFILSSEYFNFYNMDVITDGFYTMLTWEPNQHYSLSGYVSNFIPDIDNRDGSKFTEEWRKDYHAWQREAVGSLRVNLTQNWLIKGELHLIDGVAQVPYSADAAASSSRYSTMFALKTTFHF
jgi:hypothetical protein